MVEVPSRPKPSQAARGHYEPARRLAATLSPEIIRPANAPPAARQADIPFVPGFQPWPNGLLGLGEAGIWAHSLRVGGATGAYLGGADPMLISRHGRW